MPNRIRRKFVVLSLTAIFGLSCFVSISRAAFAGAQSSVQVPTFTPELALRTFDFAWELVRDSHFDEDLNGVDWEAVREELRPKAAEASSNDELRVVINEMVSRLGQSHFALLPKESVDALDQAGSDDDHGTANDSGDDNVDADEDAAESGSDHDRHPPDGNDLSKSMGETSADTGAADRAVEALRIKRTTVIGGEELQSSPGVEASSREGDFGFDIRVIDGQAVVVNVHSGSAAAERGVKPGWILQEINTMRVEPMVESVTRHAEEREVRLVIWQAITALLTGEVGSEAHLVFLDDGDRRVEAKLTRLPRAGQLFKFGNLPPMQTNLSAEWVEAQPIDVRAGLIRFSLWMGPVARPFAKAVEIFDEADGVIIDLRGNLGGMGGMVMGIGGHFINQRISLGRMIRRGQELKFNVNPRLVSHSGKRVDPYAGPVVLIVDGMSASTSEVFAAGMQGVDRVHVIGETTAGAALPAAMTRLPNGDVLLHAIADYKDPTGVSVEGRGVIPDESVKLTREDLIAGRDRPLEAALRWIAENRGREWKYDAPEDDD